MIVMSTHSSESLMAKNEKLLSISLPMSTLIANYDRLVYSM